MKPDKIIKEENTNIPDETQKIVRDRIAYAKVHPETMLDWEIVSEQLSPRQSRKKLNSSKFNGVLKVNEDVLNIQHKLMDE